jgi:glycosyltransferase involved in cell wall biosynthesis
MRIGLIAPPFIPVPPKQYGGTELFVAELATWLHERGHRVVVYANGDSQLPCEVRWRYRDTDWPLPDVNAGLYKSMTHLAWAVADAGDQVDILHLNDGVGATLSPMFKPPAVVTMHHPFDAGLAALYRDHPGLHYVAISRSQASEHDLPRMTVIHHGIETSSYTFREDKDDYLAFLGRLAPYKGAHLAIDIARRSGRRLKIAGEVQPAFRDYWESQVLPHVDGRQVEFIGEADHAAKNELLSHAAALLFPIEWEEPFGLVMIESMACGTPVLAFRRGSVPEIVEDGVNGWIGDTADDLVARARDLRLSARACRDRVAERFSVAAMGRHYEALYARLAQPSLAPPRRAAG